MRAGAKLRIAVLVSGGGTNLQAILDGIRDGSIRNAEVAAVISNNAGAYALFRAEKAGIPGYVVSPKQYPDRESFNEALKARIDEIGPDLIVLAGFLVQIPVPLVAAYENRIINIHPALIPSFSGKGCYGLHVHEAALRRGVKVSGATVHFVDSNLDRRDGLRWMRTGMCGYMLRTERNVTVHGPCRTECVICYAVGP